MKINTDDVECRCGLSYRVIDIKKTRDFICAECGMDLRTLLVDAAKETK
jgi:hypothetical protein